MSYRYHETCPYCDTGYSVEFDDEDDILTNCPACGEMIPEFEEDDEMMMNDDEWD